MPIKSKKRKKKVREPSNNLHQEIKLETLRNFQQLVEESWNPDRTFGPDKTPGPEFKRNPDGSFTVNFSQEESIEKNRLKRIGPWKKNVAAPSVSTPWPVEMKRGDKYDPTRPDFGLGAEWLAWTSGSRPVRGHKTSLKKMGLKGQPKPELAMTEERQENELSGQVSYNFFRSEGKKVPSFKEYLSNTQPDSVVYNPIHQQKLIDLYGEKKGRKFWKADVEAEEEIWKKKQKEIWKYAKEYEKRAATKDTKKSNEYLPPMIITE